MNKPIIKLLHKYQQPNTDVHGIEVIKADIPIFDEEVHLCITVENKQATLADIVPLARAISDRLSNAALDILGENGQCISCQKGCSACCNYLVPLSLSEVFQTKKELAAMPADYCRTILQRSVNSTKKILGTGFTKLQCSSTSNQYEISKLNEWYAELNISCPFLENGSCGIYEQRPLACREHLVIGNPNICKSKPGYEPEVASAPVSVLEALGQLNAELNESIIEAVILPLALTLPEDYFNDSANCWPASAIVRRFIEIIKNMALHQEPIAHAASI